MKYTPFAMGVNLDGTYGLFLADEEGLHYGQRIAVIEDKRYAELIAAAPDLYEALKDFLDLNLPEGALDNTLAQMAIEKAIKAINKAEGR